MFNKTDNMLGATGDKLARAIVDRDPIEFEKIVLKAVDGSKEFHDRVASALCKSENGLFMQDFSIPGHNALYLALTNYYTIRPTANAANIARTTLLPLLANICETPSGIGLLGQDELEEAASYMLDSIQSRELSDDLILATTGFSYWLKKRRLSQLMNSAMAKTNWSPDDLLLNAARQAHAISRMENAKATRASFGEGRKNQTLDIQRYSTGFPALDARLRGGFGKKEHVLWIAPSGAGKTVMACQLAVTLVRQGLKGLVITTEQASEELEPRMYSAFCEIPFDRIKDGVKEEKLTHAELLKVEALDRELHGKLLFENWVHDRSMSIVTNIDRLCQEFKDSYGTLDFVILDWIGGGIGDLSTLDPQYLRTYLFNTANKMADVCTEHNVMAHSFAQPNPKKSDNKKEISYTMVAECTTIHQTATTVLGISCTRHRNENTNDAYDPIQTLHCSKARKGSPGNIQIRRDFEYQRFTNPW